MNNVTPTAANGKVDPHFLDWMTGEEAFYAEPETAEGVHPGLLALEPDFYQPTPEEEREGAEIMATMRLDSFMPRRPSFKTFLAEQARLARIRDNDANWEWLGNLLTEHASRAMFTKSRTPQEYDARLEIMSGNSEAKQAVEMIRIVAGLLDHPFRAAAAELERAADRLDRYVGPLA